MIIGAGNIGAFFDTQNSREILTHAHAYKRHPGFELAGFVDADVKKAKKAAKIWGGLYAKNIYELSKKTKIDVVSVCVPDEKHFGILKEIKKIDILGGIIEKPLTSSARDSKKIVDSDFFNKRKFLVNYTRRFVPEFHSLKEKIDGGKYGKFITANAVYGKGFLHMGSHLVDLIRYLLGEIKNKKIISAIYDFGKKDPTFSLVLTLNGGAKVLVNTLDSKYFTIFELDLYFEKARVRITDAGLKIEEYVLIKDDNFKGYRKVFLEKTTKTSLHKGLYNTVDNLYDVVLHGKKPICSLKEGYENQKICTI